jgi:hypothetical protein
MGFTLKYRLLSTVWVLTEKCILRALFTAIHRVARCSCFTSTAIPDNDPSVLLPFQTGEIDKIFCFDLSEKALVMKYENHFPEYQGQKGTEKLKEYLRSLNNISFNDVLNIMSLWRPNHQEILDRVDRYRDARESDLSISILSPILREHLKPNFGQIIYHEDIIRILKSYTDWNFDQCNRFRWHHRFNAPNAAQTPEAIESLKLLRKMAPAAVVELILKETPWSFCKSHTIAFAQLVKQTAILKSLHSDLYLAEIDRWEQKFGFAWDEIGIKIDGVALMQN